jgi:murein DD-endopeptidase MepM/ murein hydrolase activator NlpD
MYEKGDVYYLELLLSADSYSDFINQNDYINMLSEYDQNMLEEYQAIVAKVQSMKEELEAEYLILDEAKLQVEQEQQALEELIVVKEHEIQGYEADIDNREQAIKEYEAEIVAQNELIESLERAKAEEKKRIAAANGVVLTYDGGAFIWPAPSYTRISDDYGYRIHPILNVKQFHNGVDMAAPKGTSMLAAYDGVVVQAGYSSTMGNYIFIDHGDGLFTIYMHANELLVATDDIVIRGEKIATIGSTGRSTGPHLHFSVRLNGSYVSPWNYLSK